MPLLTRQPVAPRRVGPFAIPEVALGENFFGSYQVVADRGGLPEPRRCQLRALVPHRLHTCWQRPNRTIDIERAGAPQTGREIQSRPVGSSHDRLHSIRHPSRRKGCPVLVEVHVSNRLPSFTVAGLPDAACREARDRVRAALNRVVSRGRLRRVTSQFGNHRVFARPMPAGPPDCDRLAGRNRRAAVASASEGTSLLIADGCGVARDAADVPAALELACAGVRCAVKPSAGRIAKSGAAEPVGGGAVAAGTLRGRSDPLRAGERQVRSRARGDGGQPPAIRGARSRREIRFCLGAARSKGRSRTDFQLTSNVIGSTKSSPRASATATFVQFPRTVLMPARSTGSAAAAPATPCSASDTT